MADEAQTCQAPDNPGTRVTPPIVLIGVIFGGYLLQQLWALELTNGSRWYPAAWVSIGAGVLILVSAWIQFFRAKTSVLHHRPANELLQSGPFRFSRNPIYVAGLLLQLGIGLWMNNLWIVLLIAVSKLAFDRYIIAGEEAYLERAFGDVYADYKNSVRRWL